MSSTRIGKDEECCLYIEDATFMLPSSELKSKAKLERERHGGLASQLPAYVDDFHKQLRIVNWDGDQMLIEASSLCDLLMSIGSQVKQKRQMKVIVERLLKQIHEHY
jgi:hypothetical protein